MLSNKIIEMLNKDPRTKPVLEALKAKSIECKITPEQYVKAREIIMLSLMASNPEVMKEYSDYVWNKLNN